MSVRNRIVPLINAGDLENGKEKIPRASTIDSLPQNNYTPEMPIPNLDQLRKALAIAEQIEKLEEEYAAILPGKPTPAVEAPVPMVKKRGGKRTFSAESRAKMAAAQRARWAKKAKR